MAVEGVFLVAENLVLRIKFSLITGLSPEGQVILIPL
jgi:hypothetical protein